MTDPMRVGLIGYGRAGQAVARILAQAEDVSLCWIAKRGLPSKLEQLSAPAPIQTVDAVTSGALLDSVPVDAIIDFSAAGAISAYGKTAAKRGTLIISAVSSYPESAQRLFRQLAKSTVVMCSPNITLGINYLLVASQLLQHIAPFTDIEVIEEHFRDKPERSGTAQRIAENLGLDETKINSIRVGGIVGHHEVVFGFPFQTVRLVHDSISREAFGNGALFALRKLFGRPPGLYTYESLVREAMLESLLTAVPPAPTFASPKEKPGRSRVPLQQAPQ